MVAEIDRLRKANESLGGVFEVRAFGLVPGLGSHVSWETRLDGRLGQALLSIQAIKAVSIGDGFEVAGVPGSQAHDEIFYDEERGYYRNTNRAGGVEGGMTTGAPLVVRGSMKPLPTLTKPLRSVDISTHEPAEALRERTDSCTVPAAGVVGEAMVAFVLADAYRQKFGGDHIDDVHAALRRVRGADRVAGALTRLRQHRLHRLHGRRQDDRGAQHRADAGPDRGGRRPRDRGAARKDDRAGLRRARRARVPRGRGADHARAARGRDPPVLALGGGAVGSPAVREALREHLVVWIDVDCETAWERVAGTAAARWRAIAHGSSGCTPSASRSTPRWPT